MTRVFGELGFGEMAHNPINSAMSSPTPEMFFVLSDLDLLAPNINGFL